MGYFQYFLIISILVAFSSAKKLKLKSYEVSECLVQPSHTLELWSGQPITFKAFITSFSSVAYQMTFMKLNPLRYYDRLHMSAQGTTLDHHRNDVVKKNIRSSLKSTGWTEFTVWTEKKDLNINWKDHHFTYTLEYPVNSITIYASNISICQQKTPSWHVTESKKMVIPLGILKNTTRVKLTISSTALFAPVFYIAGVKIQVGIQDGKMWLTPASSELGPIQPGIYKLRIYICKGRLMIVKKINQESLVMSMAATELPQEVVVESLLEDFTVSLKMREEMRNCMSYHRHDHKDIIKTTISLSVIMTMGMVVLFIYRRTHGTYQEWCHYHCQYFFGPSADETEDMEELFGPSADETEDVEEFITSPLQSLLVDPDVQNNNNKNNLLGTRGTRNIKLRLAMPQIREDDTDYYEKSVPSLPVDRTTLFRIEHSLSFKQNTPSYPSRTFQ